MAVKKFILVAGQSNALEVGDALGWEDAHRYIALRSTENTEAQAPQFSGGAYQDKLTLPYTFFGGPQRDRVGTDRMGSWQIADVSGRCVQGVNFLTFYNPIASYMNLGTGFTISYPGVGSIVGTQTSGESLITSVYWQFDPSGVEIYRSLTGKTHTITSTAINTGAITVTPPMVPRPEPGELFTYQVVLGRDSASANQLTFRSQFGGIQDYGSALDTPALTSVIATGLHSVIISQVEDVNGFGQPVRITMRGRPVSVGSAVRFYLPAAFPNLETNAVYTTGSTMSGTDITSAIGYQPFVVGDAIVFQPGNGTLPSNITAGVTYYVIGSSVDTIQISTTADGPDMTVGTGFAAGTTGPYASSANVLPSEISTSAYYYVTRLATRDEEIPLVTGNWTTGSNRLLYTGNSLDIGEAVTFTGDIPPELTVGTIYYIIDSGGAGLFRSLALVPNGSPVAFSVPAGTGIGALQRLDSNCAFYISDERGGDELVATSSTLRTPGVTTARMEASQSIRGSLTGLQARCISGTNAGVTRKLGDVDLNTGKLTITCESDWPVSPVTDDVFAIEVPPLGQTDITFEKWAMWLPWCQFEGMSPYRGPDPVLMSGALDVDVFATWVSGTVPQVGSVVRFYTTGTLPTPLAVGRDYYVHTVAGSSVFLKDSYTATESIKGDGVSPGSGKFVAVVLDQEFKANPYPPGFNYPNHLGIARIYQPFEGPSILGQNPRIGVAPPLGIRLHEHLGEQMHVAVSAFGGTSIAHKEIYAVSTGAGAYAWWNGTQMISWAPGEQNNCFARTLDVLDAIKLAFQAQGDTGECIGIFFNQGEEDASYESMSGNYLYNCTRLRTALRAAIKERDLFSGSADQIPWIQPQIKTTPWPFSSTVNAAITELASSDPYTRTLEVEDLPVMEDGVHYTGAGMDTLASRSFAAWMSTQRTGISKLELCKLALANIGDTATLTSVDPSDGSLQATVCNQYYGIALNKALEAHPWDFGVKRATPSVVTTDRTEWLFSYMLPSDYMGVMAVLPESATDDSHIGGESLRVPYTVALDANSVRRLYCNQENIVLLYRARVSDSSLWSDSFILYLGWLLSSMIAPPIIKGDEGIKASQMAMQMAKFHLSEAETNDMETSREKPISDNLAIWDRESR